MTSRELLQQALDALELLFDAERPRPFIADAIEAIRAHLAKPEPEPVAWSFEAEGIHKLDIWPHGGKWEPLYRKEQL